MYVKNGLVILKIVHGISSLVGLAPYTIKTTPCSSEKTGVNTRRECSTLCYIYNIALLLTYLLITFVVTPRLVKWQYDDQSMLIITGIALTSVGNVTSTIVIFYYTIYQQQQIDIGNLLSDFDEQYGSRFLRAGCDSSNRSENIHNYLTISSFVFMWLGVGITVIDAEYLSACVASFFTVIVVSSLLMQYSMTIRQLKGRFERLNQALPGIFKYPFLNSDGAPFAANISIQHLIKKNFLTFKQARNALYKISFRFTEFYSFPILLTTFYTCCATIHTAYYFLMQIAKSESFNVDVRSCNTLFWFMICSYPTVALSRSVQLFNSEVSKTAEVVYDIADVHPHYEEIEQQLTNFAVELIHKKVEFTACGFFSLDCTLLQSMFGAFVTYLLILIQFTPREVGYTS